MNNDRLSAPEHDDMRNLIVAGAHEIKSVGVRRMQIIAGILAFSLIGGISGGAIATAAWLGSGRSAPVSTPSPSTTSSPTPSPTPVPTPTSSPAEPTPSSEALVAFGGDCGAVLTDAEAGNAVRQPMGILAAEWSALPEWKIGGVDCRWTTSESYMGAEISVFAYPVDVVPTDVSPSPDGCEVDDAWTRCSATGVAGSTWLSVTLEVLGAEEPAVTIDWLKSATEEAYALVASRSAEFPDPRAGAIGTEWWQVDECAELAADPALAETIGSSALLHDRLDRSRRASQEGIPTINGVELVCVVEGLTDFILWPGGGDRFADIAALETSEPIDVPGAAAAVLAPSLDPYEGHYSNVVVTDGVNMFAVTVDGGAGVRDADVAFAAALLAAMSSR